MDQNVTLKDFKFQIVICIMFEDILIESTKRIERP